MKALATCSFRRSRKSSSRKSAAAIFCIFFSSSAAGFESLPEYRGLDETETTLDSPRLIDTEYTSDFVNYQKPIEWESLWWSKGVGLDYSAGSLGGKEFLVDQKLRVFVDLTEKIKFKFFWLSDRDYDEDFSTQILEMAFSLTPRLGVAAYTTLSRDKAEDDVGVALLTFKDNLETRLYVSLLDFQRNQRNRNDDRFIDGKGPVAYGLVSRQNIRDGAQVTSWREFSWRFEPKARWEFPSSTRQYEFRRESVQIRGFQRMSNGSTSAWRYNWDDKNESEDIAGALETVRRQRAWVQIEGGRPIEKGFLRFGFHHIWRRFTSPGKHAEFRDWMPFLWVDGRERLTDYGFRQWQIGYDVVFGWSDTHGGWTAEESHELNDEHRLNGVHRRSFKNLGAIDAIITFDLDRFGTGETWEGGAVRFVWAL